MQGFSAADLPPVEVISNKAGRAALARASAARFFHLRGQVFPQLFEALSDSVYGHKCVLDVFSGRWAVMLCLVVVTDDKPASG